MAETNLPFPLINDIYMVSGIIELVVGYFVAYKVPGVLGIKKGVAPVVIKIIGVFLIIVGTINFIKGLFNLIQ